VVRVHKVKEQLEYQSSRVVVGFQQKKKVVENLRICLQAVFEPANVLVVSEWLQASETRVGPNAGRWNLNWQSGPNLQTHWE
jgi:hypothetical protein